MAKGVINLQKESGGIIKISSVDGIGVTEVTVPESGNLVSVDTPVTDNAIARYDGTTGKLQDSEITIDDNNNIIGANSIFLGGNTSANQLDDYEEGTWTPTSGTNSSIVSFSNAKYIKIGNLVTVNARIVVNTTNGGFGIGGLPFTNGGNLGFASIFYNTVSDPYSFAGSCYVGANANGMWLYMSQPISSNNAIDIYCCYTV